MPSRRDPAAGFVQRLNEPDHHWRGEDPSTESLDDARRWEATYDALIAFKAELLDLCSRYAEHADPEVARAIEGTEMVLLEVQASRFRERREYWKIHAAELAGNGRRGDAAYEELQSSNEELETTNEELQSAVEELETTNEALQSSNEELETMNEELESTNAELQSINTDLRLRTDEVGKLNTALRAITGNIELGAVVLEGDMKVLVWNERAADLWGLRSDEVMGESFFDLDIGLPTNDIRAMIRAVLRGKPPHDEAVVEAVTRRGRTIRVRVMAYTLSDGARSNGVVLVMEEARPAKAESS